MTHKAFFLAGNITNIVNNITNIVGNITNIVGNITNIVGNITNIVNNITNIVGNITNIAYGEQFINKAQTRIAKVEAKGNTQDPRTATGKRPADTCLLEA